MYPVLFTIPVLNMPLPSFGAMLLLAFVVVTFLWGGKRTEKVGLNAMRFQDMAMLLLITGIAGARLVYMMQYYERDFSTLKTSELVLAFFKIWNGGIVFYGSIFGGFLGYVFFRHFVLKRLRINGWQLADAVAPLLAIGMAIGRVGCYLNGCCWGQVACEECQPVPLGGSLGAFPMLTTPAQRQLCFPVGEESKRLPQIHGLQTSLGFAIPPRPFSPLNDPRTIVAAIEPGSAAERAGLLPGDRIVQVNGEPNWIVIELSGPAQAVDSADQAIGPLAKQRVGPYLFDGTTELILKIDNINDYTQIQAKLISFRNQLSIAQRDWLTQQIRAVQRGQISLDLLVERDGQSIPLTFTPRSVTFFPTQLYETVSMGLLTLVLLAFQPFRRHDGQVMVMLMVGYAVHRFLNEAIRIEPTYAMGLTLSQWISVGIFAVAVLLELYLRWSQPKLPPGEIPLGHGATPLAET